MAQPKYEIIERIGAGGMAEVFKASSTSLRGFQKLVAIKRVLPSLTQNDRFVRMFLDEAKIALPLNHTNIVQTFDLGLADETYFIVMEYVEGTNLKEVIESLAARGQRMQMTEAVFICLEICKGLAHAHGQTNTEGEPLHIVHRDISPPNILVSRDGEVKITDFGLAKAKSQAELTDPGVVKGKFGYLSPEAAHGEDIDERTDIFAVGILLWEMLAGERLFLGESDYETLQAVRKANVPPLASRNRNVPQRLQQLLDGALAKHPDQRFQSAENLGRQLANFLFEYGKPVTSFDLKPHVEGLLSDRDEKKAPELGPAGKAVQREINQFISIDDIEDLDLRLARQETIGEDTNSPNPPPEGGDFEDPRAWDDVGIGDEAPAAPQADSVTQNVENTDDEWKEQELSDVARATQSFPAVEGPDESSDGDGSRQSNNQNTQKRSPQSGGPPNQGGRPKSGGQPQPNRRPASAPTGPSSDDQSGSGLMVVIVAGIVLLLAVGAGAYVAFVGI